MPFVSANRLLKYSKYKEGNRNSNHCSTPFGYSMTFLLQSSLARAAFWLSAQEGHECITTSPEEVHEDGWRAGALLLCKWAERVGVVRPGEERRLRGHLIVTFQYLKGIYRKAGDGLFVRECGDKMRGDGSKLKKGRFRSAIRKKFYTIKVLRHWNRFSREAVDAPCLEELKARLDGALSNLVLVCSF